MTNEDQGFRENVLGTYFLQQVIHFNVKSV